MYKSDGEDKKSAVAKWSMIGTSSAPLLKKKKKLSIAWHKGQLEKGRQGEDATNELELHTAILLPCFAGK